MTQFSKNGDMSTLSLKGRVCVPLFLFIFVLLQIAVSPAHAQEQKNRTERMYPFGEVVISSESLPDKVYEAQKNKILVSVMFVEKETNKLFLKSVGTGFVTEIPGVIITARHLLDQFLIDAEKMKKEKIKSNPRFDYTYMFTGTIVTDRDWVHFPLSLIAMGEKGTLKDIMALRADIRTMETAQMAGDLLNPNPFGILTRTSRFADAEIKEKVYLTGFAMGLAEYFDTNGEPVPILMDLVNHTFSAEIEAHLPEMPGNKTGVRLLYRLRGDTVEPGFSGGKVMNKDGNVIGMTIAMSHEKNFIYAISSKDIKRFLEENRLR